MKSIFFYILAWISILGLFRIEIPQATVWASSSRACLPSFPYQDGWLGGDAAYSIPLSPGRDLWLFGDSFVGGPSETNRARARFVRNSIAVSTCGENGEWRVEYAWGRRKSMSRAAFFDTGTGKYWYWPLDGFTRRGRLYVVLSKLRNKPNEDLFSFETVGTVLARVSNPSDPPNRWKIAYLKLTDGGTAVPGSSVVVQDGHVYFFTLHDIRARKLQRMILCRLPLDGLDRPARALEYLDGNKTWKSGFNPDDALTVIETGHSEMSVRYHSEINRWVAVSGGDFLSDKIIVRTAPALASPWSAQQTVFEIPEMSPTNPKRDPDTWCYAVKEHVQFAAGGALVVTYACNSFKLEKMLANPNIYRPRTVTVNLPLQSR